VYSGTPSNNIIRNNKIYNNGLLTQGSDTTAFGLLFHSGGNNEAYNNLIYNNTSGVAINGGSNNQIYNNTVYGNTSNGYAGIEISSGSSGTIVKNNILWQNSYDSISDSGAGTIQSNNLTTDPKFMNASANDFHLQSTSPAVNAGATISQVTTDKDGVIRPVGCCYDIGAYEYGGSTPTPTPTPSSGPSACSLYTPSSSIPAGFGSPYDVLSSPSTLLISATCDVSSARIDLGKGDPLQYIYNTGYLYKTRGTNWTPVSYTSPETLISNAWYTKSANTTISMTTQELANTSYILGYICTWQTSQWKCGCRDSQCTQSYWQIQSFKR
jgi:parallel beta-helix repeat protein